MTNGLASYYVMLDANIWVAERLLKSSLGSALLYALTEAKSSIILPEVVELEVNRLLPILAERAVARIKSESSLLRQLSGHELFFTGPTELAIKEGMAHRWKELGGLLTRVPFTYEQARSALNRVIEKTAPSGENNEQFRDCCIWDAVFSGVSDRVVHLVTGDVAFFEGRKYSSGLAAGLLAESCRAGRDIRIYPSLREFLGSRGESASKIDEDGIGSAILESVIAQAHDIAADGKHRLGKSHKPKIRGFATPKPSLVAVSFETPFDLELFDTNDRAERVTLTLTGVASYDPISKQVSEIELRQWSKTWHGEGYGHSVHSPVGSETIGQQYLPGHVRVISS